MDKDYFFIVSLFNKCNFGSDVCRKIIVSQMDWDVHQFVTVLLHVCNLGDVELEISVCQKGQNVPQLAHNLTRFWRGKSISLWNLLIFHSNFNIPFLFSLYSWIGTILVINCFLMVCFTPGNVHNDNTYNCICIGMV